ncbi:MAG TPA: hypothetical protein VHB53_10140 [Solirubrobacterales bacterium]|nr:hypothetical protein [Solirubrobacterales bacterium]
MSAQDACEVCGRTLLVGEKVHSYVSAEGRHEVCELCVGRVAELGWLPADQDGAEERLRTDAGRKPGLFGRLFGRTERDEDDDEGEVEHFIRDEEVAEDERTPDAPGAEIHELETERYDVEAEWRDEEATGAPDLPHGEAAALPSPDEVPEPDRSPAPAAPAPDADAHPVPLPDPAGRGMRPRRLQPDLSPAGRFERAVTRFNASDAGRTTAGLTRTLGAPSVSVGDLAGEEDVVRITVAWELTWYQWGVDLGDELRPVFELDRGFEVAEIDAAARQWNASAHEGRIAMVAPHGREAENSSPVHR